MKSQSFFSKEHVSFVAEQLYAASKNRFAYTSHPEDPTDPDVPTPPKK